AVNAVLDGEIVATDESGRTSFELLQQRMNLASPAEIDRIRKKIPVELVAFDLLWLDGQELTGLPLPERRSRLQDVGSEHTGLDRLEEIKADRPATDGELAKVKGARWVKPELVCEVEYLQMTAGGKLRAPSFKGLRPDKAPEDCILEPPARAG